MRDKTNNVAVENISKPKKLQKKFWLNGQPFSKYIVPSIRKQNKKYR